MFTTYISSLNVLLFRASQVSAKLVVAAALGEVGLGRQLVRLVQQILRQQVPEQEVQGCRLPDLVVSVPVRSVSLRFVSFRFVPFRSVSFGFVRFFSRFVSFRSISLSQANEKKKKKRSAKGREKAAG